MKQLVLYTYNHNKLTHIPFPVEDHQHCDEKADEENDSDGNEDHSIEDILISCRVKHID